MSDLKIAMFFFNMLKKKGVRNYEGNIVAPTVEDNVSI